VAGVAAAGRADLTDAQWAVLQPLLPVGAKPGRPPKWSKRQLIDGIRWRVRVGAPWRDVPPEYGPWQTVYGLFRRWQRTGVWRRVLTALQTRADAAGSIVWDVSVDSTVTRAHQHAAGARKRGISRSNRPTRRPVARSLTTTGWAGRGAGGPANCTWPANNGDGRCRCWSPPDSGATAHSSSR
jgi:transposase